MIEDKILDYLQAGNTCVQAAKKYGVRPDVVSAMMTNKFKQLREMPKIRLKGYTVLDSEGFQLYTGELFPVIMEMKRQKADRYKNKLQTHYQRAYNQPCQIKFFEL